jgi:hypothetical protein
MMFPYLCAFLASPLPCPPQPIRARLTFSLGGKDSARLLLCCALHSSINHDGSVEAAVTAPAVFRKLRRELILLVVFIIVSGIFIDDILSCCYTYFYYFLDIYVNLKYYKKSLLPKLFLFN